MLVEVCGSIIVPSNDSVSWCRLCSTGSLGEVLLLQRSYAALRLPTITARCALRSLRGCRPTSATRPADLPSSWTTHCLHAVLFDPGGALSRALRDGVSTPFASAIAFRIPNRVGHRNT